MALLTVPVASFTSRGVGYTVDLARRSCTCPSFAFRSMPCKHMVYVQRMASDLTALPSTARMNPEHVIPIPSSTNHNAWYAVDYVNKTCTCTGFQFRRECKHVEDALEIEQMFMKNTIQIPSYTTDGVWYTVDIEARTCSCPHYVNRHTECKHLKDALYIKEMFSASDSDSDSDSVNGDIHEDSDSDSDSDSESGEVTSAYSGAPSEEEENSETIIETANSEESEDEPVAVRRNVRRRLFDSDSASDAESSTSDVTWVPGLYSDSSDLDLDLDSAETIEFERVYLRNWRTM